MYYSVVRCTAAGIISKFQWMDRGAPVYTVQYSTGTGTGAGTGTGTGTGTTGAGTVVICVPGPVARCNAVPTCVS